MCRYIHWVFLFLLVPLLRELFIEHLLHCKWGNWGSESPFNTWFIKVQLCIRLYLGQCTHSESCKIGNSQPHRRLWWCWTNDLCKNNFTVKHPTCLKLCCLASSATRTQWSSSLSLNSWPKLTLWSISPFLGLIWRNPKSGPDVLAVPSRWKE